MSKIHVIDPLSQHIQNTIFEADGGTNLLEFLREHDFFIESPCGGNGTCGKCRVKINGEFLPACRISISGDCTVELPFSDNKARLSDERAPFSGKDTGKSAQETEAYDFHYRPGLGAAVDLGTTTVAVSLYDLSDGRLLGTTGAWNTQISYGADVITRIQYCMDRPRGLSVLARAIRRQVRLLIQDLMDRAAKSENPPISSALTEVVIAGNTIMQHIFAGIDPSSIAQAPFLPRTKFQEKKTYTFPEFRGCQVFLLPCLAGYVGGDITSGLFASNLREKREISLFLDIGTNGEMALGGSKGFTCCSVASGPAFEGAEITCGMRSIPGAIRHIEYIMEDACRYGSLSFSIIGFPKEKPKGLCGSALIDLLAILLKTGTVDETGRLLGPSEAPESMRPYLTADENDNGIFWLDKDHTVCLRPEDVRQLQLAKAAVAAGITTLMKKEKVTCEEIDHVYIAGSFGKHLRAENAAAIGMIPKDLKDKVIPVGNTSLAGAVRFLSDPDSFEALLSICEACDYIELSLDPGFSEEYINQMMF